MASPKHSLPESGNEAGSVPLVIENKIARRWMKRWEPIRRFGTKWSARKSEHRITMLKLFKAGVEMRMITRNEWDDPWLDPKDLDALVRCWREKNE